MIKLDEKMVLKEVEEHLKGRMCRIANKKVAEGNKLNIDDLGSEFKDMKKEREYEKVF